MTHSFSNTCLGVVLAGGLSSRMGENKAHLQHKHSNMLTFSQKLLQDSGIEQVVVSGNEYQVPDIVKNMGPLGGIYSILQRYQPKSILVLPVDLPLMDAKSLTQLRLAGELSNKACFFCEHNIPLYLPNNAYLEMFLTQAFKNSVNTGSSKVTLPDGNLISKRKNGPSIKALLAAIPHQVLTPDNVDVLFNSNTPEQWQIAKQRFNPINT